MLPAAIIHVGEIDFPVDLNLVTLDQVIGLRSNLGVDENDLQQVLGSDDDEIPVPVVVALLVLSCKQQGQPADASWLAERITLATAVTITRLEAPAADPEAADLLAALANP